MSIHRTGPNGPPAPLPDAASTHAPGTPGSPKASFSLERPDASAATATTSAEASRADLLRRVRAGEIDIDTYAELRIDEACKGLSGLSPAEHSAIRSVLRDRLATDPEWVSLVKAATGKTLEVADE